MRSRTRSCTLALVLLLSVLMIVGSSGPGFLALAQSDGTPIVEEPVPEEQLPVEVATETSTPDLPAEVPIFPSETVTPRSETPLPVEPATTEDATATLTATPDQTLADLPMNFTGCQLYAEYWNLVLNLPVPQMPSSILLTFTNGATAYANWFGSASWNGSSFQGSYSIASNAGAQLASVTALLTTGMSGSVDVLWANDCWSGAPNAPTRTATTSIIETAIPTSSVTPTTLFSTFVDCTVNQSMWFFRLRTQGALPGGASWPSTVELTFASGATGTAGQITQTIGENAAQFEFRSMDNLSDVLVSGTLSLPIGVAGVLELMYAPNCSPGVLSSPTNVPSETPTSSSTPADTATPIATSTSTTTTYTAGFDYCIVSNSGWFWQLDFHGTLEELPATIFVTFASGATISVPRTAEGLSGATAWGWYQLADNLSDHVVSATAEAPTGVSVWFELTQGTSCQAGLPGDATSTATPTSSATATITNTPTVTLTPTLPSTTELLSADFTSCQPQSWWYLQLFIEAETSWLPQSITLTFASGATATVGQQGTDTVAGVGSWAFFNWYQNLSDELASATAEVYAGTIGTLDLVWAPNCHQGVPDGSTETPVPTATSTDTPTETLTPSLTPTATPTEDLDRAWVSFNGCLTNNGNAWNLTYRYIGALTTAVPTLTFSDGRSATASIAFHTDWGNGEYETEAVWMGNLDAQLVSATLPRAGMQLIDFRVRAAPNCEQGTLSEPNPTMIATSTATHVPTETATASATASEEPTETATSTSIATETSTASATVIETTTPTATASETVMASVTPSATESSTATETSTGTATPTNMPTETATATNTPTDLPTETATASNTPTASPSSTATATPTDTATTTSTPTDEPTQTFTPTSTVTASTTPTVTAMPTWSGITTTLWATFDECNSNPEIWYFRLTVQGALPDGASWPESVAMSFASGTTALAHGFDQVVGENTAQLWFSSNGHLEDALVSATVGLPSELTGLLELLYAPNCLQGVPVTATSMPTETMTASATATETASPTITATATATETATPSSTATDTPTETATASRTSTPLHTETATEIPTETAAHTPTATSSATKTITPSETPTETPPSSTATPTEPPSSTSTVSSTPTSTATATATSTSTSTSTATITSTRTLTNTATATVTESITSTSTPTASTTAAVPMVRTTANVHCRIGASTSTTSLGVVSRGTFLPMRGVVSGGWTPVICFGQNGWMSTSYLATSPAATATEPASAMMTTTTRVNCRTGGSTGSAIIGVVPARTTLALRGVVQGGWYPVICFGKNGWISASYLAPGPIATTTPPSGPQAVTTTRVNCRTAPATSQANVIIVLDSGVTVPVRGAAANGWTPVVCDDQNGWISSRYVRIS